MKYNTKLLLIFFCLTQLVLSQEKVPLSKERTVILYDSLYKSSEINKIQWNGNLKTCNPGTLPKDLYKKAENRINFFRLVNGLTTVRNNENLNENAQNSALLSKANNKLTHFPEQSMKCYSESANLGCQKSCLSLTNWDDFPKTYFITSFIDDYGKSNYFVGHRRWLLYTKLKEFGYGATNSSESLLTADGTDDEIIQDVEFVAYPWSGFVPVDLIFPKWSFSIDENKKVNFKNVKIVITDSNGRNIEIKKLPQKYNFLDHTIVWTVTGLFSYKEIYYSQNNLVEKGYLNKKIKVQIKNVQVDGKRKDFEYFVEPI